MLWTQHAHDQPAVQVLCRPEVAGCWDGMAFVSRWQEQSYEKTFGRGKALGRVMRNAVGPAFASLAASDKWRPQCKPRPPLLAYTSTPFRGLELLLGMFAELRAAVPSMLLKIYSSMQVYQMSSEQDQQQYGDLYRICRETEGVEHVGSLPQPALAEAMSQVSLLVYPNTFAETSCISVMEAMASGCQVVTSDLGALSETTAGFARLIPLGNDRMEYRRQFVAAVVAALHEGSSAPEQTGRLLARQNAFIREQCTWPTRAAQWSAWLQELGSR